jgi:hypothetical protein
LFDERSLHAAIEATFSAETAGLVRERRVSVHLAVMKPPYLRLILSGEKTVESRFARRAIAPLYRVFSGDLILFKAAGGGVRSAARVERAVSVPLDDRGWSLVRDERHAIGVDEAYLNARADAQHAALMWLSNVTRLPEPLSIDKRDRRGWVILTSGEEQLCLF